MAQNTHVDVVIVQGNLIEIFGEIKMLGNYPDFHFDKKLSVITSDKTNQQFLVWQGSHTLYFNDENFKFPIVIIISSLAITYTSERLISNQF